MRKLLLVGYELIPCAFNLNNDNEEGKQVLLFGRNFQQATVNTCLA